MKFVRGIPSVCCAPRFLRLCRYSLRIRRVTLVRAFFVTFVVVGLVIIDARRARAELADSEIEIDSEMVELDRETGVVHFRGNVMLRHDELRLRCDQLTARTSEEGQLQAIEAAGHVSITTAGLQATAGAVSYLPLSRQLILMGRPTVTSTSGTLRGRRIEVDLRSSRVSIEEAHGVFRIN